MKESGNTINNYLKGLSDFRVFIFFWVYALFIRWPFFFRDYIDRDESTFILMGQSWVDGHLPYTELWDLKPPITFLFFASIIYIFGKSLVAIRIAGTLLVTISAFYTFKIGARYASRTFALVAGLVIVVLFSLFGSVQGVMSEHICMAFFMPALYLYIFKEGKWALAGSGLLFGLAMMSKLNLAYPVLFLFLLQIIHSIASRELLKLWPKIFYVGIGILFTLLFTLLPYMLSSQPELWWNSVILAPLAYTDTVKGSWLKLMVPIGGILVLLCSFHFKKWLDLSLKNNQILVVTILGILVSFIQAQKMNGHYLMQLYPILILTLMVVASKFQLLSRLTLGYGFMLVLFLLPLESYNELHTLTTNHKKYDTLFNGEGFAVPNYVNKNNLAGNSILFLEYHIGYWILDQKPLTKISTHPSNLMREELFPFIDSRRKTTKEELNYLLNEIQPSLVVVRKDRTPFDPKEIWANNFMAQQLDIHYRVLDTLDAAVIYQRLPGQ